MEIEIALTFGEFDHALELAENFASQISAAQMQMFIPLTLLMKARALLRLDRVEEAREALLSGQNEAERQGLYLVLMYLQIQRFELEVEHGSPEEIEATRNAARQTVANIANQIEDVALRDRFLGSPRIQSLLEE
jgi:hypothetical protein